MSIEMFSAKIKILGKEEIIQAYFDALNPEQNFRTERANYKLKLEKNKMTITISAKDATAFRAVITSLAGLMSVVDKTYKTISIK